VSVGSNRRRIRSATPRKRGTPRRKTPSAALRRGGVAGASSDQPSRFAHDKTRSKTSAEAWPVRHV